ncbi:MAG: rhodanese-like domain-containing protein [Phycisphaerales bacterium JB038]
MKKVLLQACVIAALASWAGVLSAQFWPLRAGLQAGVNPPTLPVDDVTDPAPGDAEVAVWPPAEGAIMINVATAKLAWDMGYAEFVDARSEEEFKRAQVIGAWNVSQADLANSGLPTDFHEFVGTDTPLIIYCEGGECDTSENVAIRLQDDYLYQTIYILKPGIPGWVKAAHPMDGEDVEGFIAEVEAYED